MKHCMLFLTMALVGLLSNFCEGQKLIPKNLVPNASFEHLIDLPLRPNKANYFEYEPLSGYIPFQRNIAFWQSANINTPDLRICPSQSYSRLKAKYDYAVRPRKGNVMVGIITYMSNYSSDTYREYIQLKLKGVVKPNIKTFCELWICKDRKAKLVSNNIGFYFSQRPISRNHRENLPVKPQVNHREVINKDGSKWEKISGYFYPDKPYIYLTIGNFYDNDSTVHEKSAFNSAHPRLEEYASYLIDDVRVWQENDTLEEAPIYEIVAKEPVRLNNIHFEFDSDKLLSSSTEELEKLLLFLQKNPALKIAIHGHTDNVGEDAFNLDLSERRAKAVIRFLASKGVSTTRLQSAGFGEQRPIDSNETTAGRLNNRRVEFVVLE